MSSGLISGLSSGLGQSLGTSAAGSAAGQAAAETAGSSLAGSVGSAIGSGVGGTANGGAGGGILRLLDHGSAAPAGGTGTAGAATSAADPSNSKGGWLGLGLFGNDKYNPNPSTYAPETGAKVASAAMPKPPTNPSIALQLLSQLPITDRSLWT